ncbi:LysM peptidoglycan-binding domain-containing protein [Streptomyces cavernicola]|uniref:LysM peptidoglycan-binding domain-containing protein n=1 Tax=Streptomyces cavernicola TaxID=3043613 RepID=A0ABT6S9H4_9ACTN|nr:LysM peptidoglycan-binding domain-containing protein [Streptomyces sp. B-S-A6]MDI3403961.1 LysM peptidoglycan-binding domain-containing protein [Streptomyces sp. B-S-A6]
MPANGKHRRLKPRSLTRGIAAAGTGGLALVLPLIAANAASAAPAATVQTSTAAKPAAAKTYVVVAGDTLSEIAQKQSVSGGWKKLYADNRSVVGDDPRLIHPGVKLTLGKKAAAKADASRASAERADRSERTTAVQAAAAPAKKSYTNDLDGWIKESLDIMAERGIPGTYEGIHRNIMRESSGNPLAMNNWDINAQNGTPSKGLLQVIAPTFEAYHVPGTSTDSFDPVANITAACNYAADRYGSIDNVNGPY